MLRPLPIIFTFLNLVDRRPHMVNEPVRRIFITHLRAFRATLIALGRGAALPAGATDPLLTLCDRLATAETDDPGRILAKGRQALRDLQQRHGPALVKAARDQKEAMRDLFRAETGPLRLLVVHHDDTASRADAIFHRLVDDCWYDCGIRHEDDGVDGLVGADLVLLVPSATPIRTDLVQALGEHEIASLVLIRTGTAGPSRDMAALRISHLYRKEGHAVMQGKAVPLRLYPSIDRLVLLHRADHPVVPPAVRSAMTATS